MKVKLLTTLAGPQGCHTPGALLDLPVDLAHQYVRRGFAEWIGEPPTEQAAAPVSPTAKLFVPPTPAPVIEPEVVSEPEPEPEKHKPHHRATHKHK